MKARYIHLLVTIVLLAGCQATQPVRPFTSGSQVSNITSEENRLWVQARDFDDAILKSESTYQAPKITSYVQSVMDKLFPEFNGKIPVRIYKSPHLNAFALPNGSIYFHTGMLARLENEAQLATILAHEGIHFINKHGLQQQRNVKGSSAFALATAVAGLPIVGNILAMSSITGFSRDLEREADSDGYNRLIKAGYDPAEAAKPFKYLAAEIKALEIDEPFFFSSHPKLEERINNFTELAKNSPAGGITNEKVFREIMRPVRMLDLETNLSMNRYKSVLLILENEDNMKTYPVYAQYYLGEAYRQRGDTGDIDKAEAAYLKAAKLAPDFAPSHSALGIHYMKKQEFTRARHHFTKYLALAPDAKNRGYIKQYMNNIMDKR